VRAHLAGRDDGVVAVPPVLERVGPFAEFADDPFDEGADFAPRALCGGDRTAVGSEGRLNRPGHQPARPLVPRKRGPKPPNLPDTPLHDLFSKLSP
jgi:REP-associated tyrosine transposase